MSGAVADDLVAVFVVGFALMIPIVAMLVKHQQKMAELFREERMASLSPPQVAAENEALRKELADVKALLYEQSIAIDNLGKREGASGELKERLEDRAK